MHPRLWCCSPTRCIWSTCGPGLAWCSTPVQVGQLSAVSSSCQLCCAVVLHLACSTPSKRRTNVASVAPCCCRPGDEGQQQQQQLPGRFLLPVTLWPCAKLARGVALVSSSVWAALVQPEQGTFLALYPLQPANAPGGSYAAMAAGSLCVGTHTASDSSTPHCQQQFRQDIISSCTLTWHRPAAVACF